MHHLCAYLIQQGNIVRVYQADVQPLGEIHPGTAFCKLLYQLFMFRAGQEVRIHQFYLFLPIQKFRKISDLYAPSPFLAADNTKSAVPGASTA